MGPTGVGKSSFINTLLDEGQPRMIVGGSLQSCTAHICPVTITEGVPIPYSNHFKGGRLVIVDTPGFDDTNYGDDSNILRRISLWLAGSYSQKMKLGGVIYLHDISQPRMLGTTRRNLDIFQNLVGKKALNSIVLGTTKWGSVQPKTGLIREQDLQSTYWIDMVKAGSSVFRVAEGAQCARNIVNHILCEIDKQVGVTRSLKIQQELVNMKKIIPETDAGKALKYSLDQLIEMQKKRAEDLRTQVKRINDEELRKEFEAGEEKLRRLVYTAKEMRVPLSRRLKKFFDMVSLHTPHLQMLRGCLTRISQG
ncbi:P-loop containing nucleoside triphosphate hydrolase protein [Flammula alnicola]|nr:P-loop containing nucleoside triphosphate hydrolase protein [Flammula alnicola]